MENKAWSAGALFAVETLWLPRKTLNIFETYADGGELAIGVEILKVALCLGNVHRSQNRSCITVAVVEMVKVSMCW